MRVIQVSVEAKNLPKTCFAVSEERFRESRLLPDPVMARKGCKRSVEGGRTHCDRRVATRSARTSWGKWSGVSRRIIRRERFWIMNLTNYPSLNE